MNAMGGEDASAAAVATRHKILVINDSPDFLTFMREFLTLEGGFDVATYDQSAQVLQQVSSSPPDLIVLDVVFRHGPSGLDVANELAQAAGAASIPVLFCTALTARDLGQDVLELVHSRQQQILYKPFDVDDLLRIINAMLQERGRDPEGLPPSGGSVLDRP